MRIEAIDRRFRQIAQGLDFVEVKDHEMSPVRPHSLRSGFRSRLTGKAEFHFKEYGYTQRRELRETRVSRFLWIERDSWFEPRPLEGC